MKKRYLDYAGLKRVLKHLLPGARKIWHGTLAEWEALSETERDKYDQAEIIDGSGYQAVAGGISKYTGREHTTGIGMTPGIEIVTLPKGHKYIVVAHFEITKDIRQTTTNMNTSLYVGDVYQEIRFNPSGGGGAIGVLLADVTDNDAVVRCKAHNSSNEDFDFIYEVQVMTLA